MNAEVLLKVVRHRIVVATCDTSGGIYKLGLIQGHFSHCFIVKLVRQLSLDQ